MMQTYCDGSLVRVNPPGLLVPDGARYDPLVGGIQIGPCKKVRRRENGADIWGYLAGTLGLIVVNTRTGNRAMLTNHHVLYGEQGDNILMGTAVSQPAPPNDHPDHDFPNVCASVTDGMFGTVKYGGKEYGIDAAIADLTRDDIGRYMRSSRSCLHGKHVVARAEEALLGMKVWKVGFVTGLTYGEVVCTNFSVPAPNTIVIRSIDDNPFALNGDSGSVVVDDMTGRIVGLLRAGVSPGLIEGGEKLGFACHIAPVIAQLHIQLQDLGGM